MRRCGEEGAPAVDRTTEEKRGTKGRRTRYTKGGKKGSPRKEKSSGEERKANAVVVNVRMRAKDYTRSQRVINGPGVHVEH
jgi:hypothetical protein